MDQQFEVRTQDGQSMGTFHGDSADDVRHWVASWYRYDPRHLIVTPSAVPVAPWWQESSDAE